MSGFSPSTACSQVEKHPAPWVPIQMNPKLVIYQSEMGAGYSSVLSGDVTLCMQTPWKWATHTEDEVGRKTPVSRVWSGSHDRVPLHSLDEPPWSGIQTLLSAPMADLDWSRWMHYTVNEAHFCSFISMKAASITHTKKFLSLPNMWICVFLWLAK